MRRIFTVFFFLTLTSLHAQTNTVLTSATCPVCTAAQYRKWFETHDSTVRILPTDRLGHRIGINRANSYGTDPKWKPWLRDKRVVCGTFRSFGLRAAEPEWDWNLQLRTTAYSQPLVDDVRERTMNTFNGWLNVQKWACDGNCIKGEITTDNGFYDNPYFFVDVPTVTFSVAGFQFSVTLETMAHANFATGDTLCMYGPFVSDLGHHQHPEIHPSEVIWWRDKTSGALYALLLQDDSNRFDRREDFDITDEANWSRPWSAFPRWNELRVSFLAEPTGVAPGHMVIDGLERHRIVTPDNAAARADSDDGTEHALEFDGNVVLRVSEIQAVNDRIGVRFVDVCRYEPGDGSPPVLIGYVSLNTVIGDADRGESEAGDEGYYVLRIDLDEPPPQAAPVVIMPFTLHDQLQSLAEWRRRRRPPGDSVSRFTPSNISEASGRTPVRYSLSPLAFRRRGSRLTAEARVTPVSPTPSPDRALSAAVWIDIGAERQAAWKGPRSTLPIARGGAIVIRGMGGDSITQPIPRLMIAPVPRTDAPARRARDPEGAAGFIRAVEPGWNMQGLKERLMRASHWTLDLLPTYDVAPDQSDADSDENPIAAGLNRAVRRGAARAGALRLQSLFGTTQPFAVSWVFSAKNLLTGDSVLVRRGVTRPNQNEIVVGIAKGAFNATRLSVQFPTGGPYQLTATATVTDVHGVTGAYTHIMSNAYLAADSTEAFTSDLLQSVQSVTISNSSASPVIGGFPTDVLRELAENLAADRRASIEELSTFVRAASKYARQAPSDAGPHQ